MKDEKPLREALTTGAKAGRFLQTVYAISFDEREERDDLAIEVAALHNEGLVDVVAAFGELKRNALDGPDFFLMRYVFEKTLPHLNAPVDPIMRCTLQLCREAGEDFAAGTILNGYVEFCTKDPARPRAALKLIEADPSAFVDMMPATIAAGSKLDNSYYMAEIIRLSSHPEIEVRRRAIFSMARFHWQKEMSVLDTAITALEKTVNAETDDLILANAIKSAFALFHLDRNLEVRCVALIGTALAKGDEYSLYAASELLWRSTKDLPSAIFQLLLTHLRIVKPENVGTLNNIDLGIAHLLKQNDPESGLHFLEDLLTTHEGKLKVEIFDSATNVIRASSALMGKVLTRWFLRGERVLCEAVHDVVGTRYGNDLRIGVDVSELKPADYIHILFIARKAIGYFFMQPMTAASVVISLMHHAPDDETLNALGELLFDPLLLNYTGSTCHSVKEQAERESGKIKETIENALTSIEQYLEILHSVPELPALHPGQSQRESYRRHMSESMAESTRAAEKKSIFFGLFSHSTLLYGNKSITYVNTGSGEPNRTEIPLTRHSVSMEFPRMENIDPYGLNYMLRVFRAERFRT
jgi:hypothetical protein